MKIIHTLLSEGMDSTAVEGNLPVHFGIAHLLFKSVQISRFLERIICAGEDEHLAFDVFAVGGRRRIESTMKADDAVQLRAAAGQFDHRRAAETIADGGDAAG